MCIYPDCKCISQIILKALPVVLVRHFNNRFFVHPTIVHSLKLLALLPGLMNSQSPVTHSLTFDVLALGADQK